MRYNTKYEFAALPSGHGDVKEATTGIRSPVSPLFTKSSARTSPVRESRLTSVPSLLKTGKSELVLEF
jgi:hypothetical protein